jgi:hypothetical protein
MKTLHLASLALLAAALPIAACGGDDTSSSTAGTGGGGGSGGSGVGGAGGTSPSGLPAKEDLVVGEWNEIQPGGETICSRGTPYSFWVLPGKTDKVVVDFIGGGACWDEFTCGVADAIFSDSVEDVRAVIEAGEASGFYDHANADNPIADYWHVIIPYCTGDIHWGNAVTTYGEGDKAVTIQHKGAVNASAVVGWVYENFASPEQLFVTGCSAGSYGSLLWSSHIMEHYPESKVFQFGDSGAGVITQDFFQDSFPSWNAEQAFPNWIPELNPESVDLYTKELADLYTGISNHYPEHVMSQYNTIRDENQVFYFQAMGGGGVDEWTVAMQASIAKIESGAERFASYTAPGEQHCILPYDNFYTVETNGVRLVDWLKSSLESNATPESAACQAAECDAATP